MGVWFQHRRRPTRRMLLISSGTFELSRHLELQPCNRIYLDLVATAALCGYIGDISGFTRCITVSARIARFRSIGLHPVTRSVAGNAMASFLPVLLHLVAGCLARYALCKHGGRRSNDCRGGKRDYCEFHLRLLWKPRAVAPAVPEVINTGCWRVIPVMPENSRVHQESGGGRARHI